MMPTSMASPVTSLSFSLDAVLIHSSSSSSSKRPSLFLNLPSSSFSSSAEPSHSHLFLSLHKPNNSCSSLKSFHAPHSSLPPSTGTFLDNPPPRRTGRFLGSNDFEKLQFLEDFRYTKEFNHGFLEIRLMALGDVDATVGLLAESFGESMRMPAGYISLLAFLVKQYVLEKRALLPHTATLVGFYKERDGVEERLAGTAEISFDAVGANASPPTPVPPRDFPYICNMTVTKELRRRRIGWQLLKACENLISYVSSEREVYLHCRMIDTGPFEMYKKAGYHIVKTDSILVWFIFQRRKHLMCKKDIPSDSFGLDDLIV